MIKVSGLPVQITKQDLDKLFSEYGDIRITKKVSLYIKIEKDTSIAYLELDSSENELRAVDELNNKLFRDKSKLKVERFTP